MEGFTDNQEEELDEREDGWPDVVDLRVRPDGRMRRMSPANHTKKLSIHATDLVVQCQKVVVHEEAPCRSCCKL